MSILNLILGKQKIGPKNGESVLLQRTDSTMYEANIVHFPKYCSRFRKGKYVLQLTLESRDIVAVENEISYFHAMLNLREEIAKIGITLCCWGAKLEVWPSGMAVDMGAGLQAASRVDGEEDDMRSIFSPIEPNEIATIENQLQYIKSVSY